jgi:ABC-type sugar transport system substrate-binding protein
MSGRERRRGGGAKTTGGGNPMRFRTLKCAAAGVAALFALGVTPAISAEILIGLITKTNNNPFFVKMKEGARCPAAELRRQVRRR